MKLVKLFKCVLAKATFESNADSVKFFKISLVSFDKAFMILFYLTVIIY